MHALTEPKSQRESLSPTPCTIAFRDVRDLAPFKANPRAHSSQQIEKIARSIAEFGFLVPILIDENNSVIAGHGRLRAAQQLGMVSVPTIQVEHLSEAQKRAYRVADNRLTELSTWDDALLAENLALLAQEDLTFDLSLSGFELPEVDILLHGGEEKTAQDDPDDAQVGIGPAVSLLGDVWELGPHRIVCGDALDPEALDRLMQGEKAAMVFTDAHYNLKVSTISGFGRRKHREFERASGEMTSAAFTSFLQSAMALMAKHSVDGAMHFHCIDFRHLVEIQAAAAPVYSELKSLIVWVKNAGGMGSLYRNQHELILLYKLGTAPHRNNIQLGRFGRNRTNVWEYSAPRKFGSDDEGDLLGEHPTPKPVAMIADALMDTSNRGEIVLDTFLGSGSTLIAAERVGRVARGVELDPIYVDLAIRRWQRLTGRSAVHAQLHCTFDELAECRLGDFHG